MPIILGTFFISTLGDDNIIFLTKHSIQDTNNRTGRVYLHRLFYYKKGVLCEKIRSNKSERQTQGRLAR